MAAILGKDIGVVECLIPEDQRESLETNDQDMVIAFELLREDFKKKLRTWMGIEIGGQDLRKYSIVVNEHNVLSFAFFTQDSEEPLPISIPKIRLLLNALIHKLFHHNIPNYDDFIRGQRRIPPEVFHDAALVEFDDFVKKATGFKEEAKKSIDALYHLQPMGQKNLPLVVTDIHSLQDYGTLQDHPIPLDLSMTIQQMWWRKTRQLSSLKQQIPLSDK